MSDVSEARCDIFICYIFVDRFLICFYLFLADDDEKKKAKNTKIFV